MLLREIITEGLNRYKPMFAPYYEDNNIPSDVVAKMNDIERIMQRQDRVIWMMRWYRFHLHGFETLPNDATPEQAKSYQSRMNKLTKDVGTASLDQAQSQSQVAMKLMSDFEHWFSLPVARIKSFVFERQSPQVIFETLRDIEDEWIESRERTVKVEDHHDMVIDFGNGWAWFNLNESYCRKEGEAMGHCGNSASYKHDDTILSLREHVYEDLWSPHLTFVLHGDGYLGEMKGRANEKPTQKYHSMIYKLLQHDLVQGISGGGYMPEHNFKLGALTHSEITALKEAKPGFCNYWELTQAGRIEEANKMVKSRAADRNVTVDYENKDVIIDSYKTTDSFINAEVWGWDTLFERVDRDMGGDTMFYQFRNDYYYPSLKEHIYDMKDYVHDVSVKFLHDGKVHIIMDLDEFMSVTDPDDEDSDEWGSNSGDLDEEREGNQRDMGDISDFLDDIDEAIMAVYLDEETDNRKLIELIQERYGDEETKRYSFGSPTVKDYNQHEFDFDRK